MAGPPGTGIARGPGVTGAAPRPARCGVLRSGHRVLLAVLALAAVLPVPPLPVPAARAQDPGPPRVAGDGEEKGKDDKGKGKGKGDGKGEGKDKGGDDKGKGKGKGADDGAPPKRTEEEVFLQAVADAWKAGDVKALSARLPERGKVMLTLPGAAAGAYRREQAVSLLEDYFRDRTFRRATLKAVEDLVGTVEVEYVRASDRKEIKARVLLTVDTEDRRRVLAAARESP